VTDITPEEFLRQFPPASLVDPVAQHLDWPHPRILSELEEWFAEVPMGFATIERHLTTDARILEVGAGLGLLSLYLSIRGYDVVALEPVGRGYGFFHVVREAIARESPWPLPRGLEIGAEQLRASGAGPFDLIFSIHVLEHVQDLPAVVDGMLSVLAVDGRMVHLCPNYTVPYEPHFGFPLLPGRPGAVAGLFREKIAERPEVFFF
jgi:2-polyprenyl-3-methyl-5-hydroxy-6-metoxy-1,4-benzoquinol methylase